MDCPNCGKKMKENPKHKAYACDNINCDDKWVAFPKSIIGIN